MGKLLLKPNRALGFLIFNCMHKEQMKRTKNLGLLKTQNKPNETMNETKNRKKKT